jgi:ubiquitin C-terminal hydrolase
MDLSKYYKKGMVGLENLGSTCFLNACMQVLNNTYELNAFIDSDNYSKYLKKDVSDSVILTEWADLKSVMWSGNGVVAPRRFVYNVQQVARIKKKELFTGFVQNDMPEFLQFFLECVHNSISRHVSMKISGQSENEMDNRAIKCYNMLKETYSSEYSEIMDMYYGIYMSEIISIQSGECHSMKPESYFILDLPIQNERGVSKTIYDCFDTFTAAEVMEGDNAWLNETTGKKEDIKKQISFWNFPNIVVITFNRFSVDGSKKLNAPIEFPLEDLDLSSYVRGYNANSYKYDLFGICNHIGGVSGGHYTAFVRNAENRWLHYNDLEVEIVDDPTNVITPLAYCLFYRKKNNLL